MTVQEKIRRQKVVIVVLAILLLISLVALGGVLLYAHLYLKPSPAAAPDNIITTQAAASGEGRLITLGYTGGQVTAEPLGSFGQNGASAGSKVELELSSSQTTDNSRFYLTNMFPGDRETKPYCVKVSWQGTVTVNFRADIYQGYEKLAEVLKCRVTVEGQQRYDGLMRDMPVIGYTVSSGRAASRELDYEIEVYLETSVGNDYQRKQLMADFVWWVEEDGGHAPVIPGGGEESGVLPELEKGGHYAYIIGQPDGLVHPEAEITRAETTTIFFRLLTEDSRRYFWSRVSPYYDVSAEAWYNNAVSTLTNAGILNGRPGNVFDPDGSITRAEFAAIAARFFVVETEAEKDYFSDISGHWANEEINRAYILGLVEGYPDGTFRPDQPITRAEAMTLVNRILERAPEKDHLLESMIRWPDNMDPDKWYYAAVQEATNSHAYVLAETCEDEIYEVWTELLEVRDWAALEREWSEYDSSANPGEPIGSMLMQGNMGVVNAGSGDAEMSVTTLRELAGEGGSLNILFSDCQVLFDPAAVSAILEGSGAADVTVQVRAASGAALTDAQQAALSRLSVARVVTASVNEGAVSDFGGGLATVYVPFPMTGGTGACSYSVVYVSEDGTLEYIDSYYLDGYIVFFAEHFSDYVIVRDLDRSELTGGRLVSTLRAEAGWLWLAIPAGAVLALSVFLILRRKEGKHEAR